jgi:hypothetical protein
LISHRSRHLRGRSRRHPPPRRTRRTAAQIAERFHPLSIWLDAGFGEPRELEPWRDADGIVPVLGSESLRSASDLPALLAVVPHALLSLDTRDELALGPAALFEQPQAWPQRVIVMTLDRVGAGSGPAWTRLQTIAAQAPGKQLIAAGAYANRGSGNARAHGRACGLDRERAPRRQRSIAQRSITSSTPAESREDTNARCRPLTAGARPNRLAVATATRAAFTSARTDASRSLRLETTSAGCGSPRIARSIDSLVAL